MRRREFIALTGAAAATVAAFPRAALAQATKVPRVAWADGAVTSVAEMNHPDAVAFAQEMARLGFVEGRTITFDRYVASSASAAQETARKIVASSPDVIFLQGAIDAILAVMALTKSIPIVSQSGDPLGQGVVSNLARPGGNVTAVANTASAESEAKVLSILAEAVPTAKRVAYIGVGPAGQFNPGQQGYLRSATEGALKLGLSMTAIPARDPADEQGFRDAFALAKAADVEMIQLARHGQIRSSSSILAELALDARMPAISPYDTFPPAGGLLSYGANVPDGARKAARYVALVLNGAKPGDLPVQEPTVFDLIVNMTTAKAIGITIPPSILTQATLVIE
jgi:putative ABC transport system substrate-binding protein